MGGLFGELREELGDADPKGGGDMHADDAAVGRIGCPLDEADLGEPVDGRGGCGGGDAGSGGELPGWQGAVEEDVKAAQVRAVDAQALCQCLVDAVDVALVAPDESLNLGQ